MFDKSWPVVVAHRGASSSHAENTLEAFDGAVKVGADVVELDVRLTADEVPVVMHDPDLSRTTDGTGWVHERTLEEIRRVDASGGRGPRTCVPTLRETLQALRGRICVNLELKNMPGEPSFDSPLERVAAQSVALVEELDMAKDVLLSSFNWLTIERVRDLSPGLATGFLTIAGIDPEASLMYAASKGHGFVLPQAEALMGAGEGFVRSAHARGVRVGTWTVDRAEDVQRLFEMGVDAVATNVPEMAVAIRDRFRAAGGSAQD